MDSDIEALDEDNYLFYNEGWADGYVDIPEKHYEIIELLCRNNSVEDMDAYLQGYELGKFMSKNVEFIYNEDGFLKEDGYGLCSFSRYEEAKMLVYKYNEVK